MHIINMHIYYGIEANYIDITYIACAKCAVDNNNITIPIGDHQRAKLFGDPIYNVLKHIKVVDDNDKITLYNAKVPVNLTIKIFLGKSPPLLKAWHLNFATSNEQLDFIHHNMLFNGGHIRDEYPEQLLITKYITSNSKVLELGANYGRSTLTIAALLEDESNLVTLECDKINANVAQNNRDLNNYKFHIEKSALSIRRLFQKECKSYIEELKPSNAIEIDTITWPELQHKYQIEFDTLVADCEDALYYILKDEPSLLDNIKLIIVENNYCTMTKKLEIDTIYRKAGLVLVESTVVDGRKTCLSCFYEVWMRKY